MPKNDFKNINKPKGLKVAKEDQKADESRVGQRDAEREAEGGL